jgi:hypothetical protein
VNEPTPASAAPTAKSGSKPAAEEGPPAQPPGRPVVALLPAHQSPARDIATASFVLIGFGIVRSLVQKRSIVK